MNTASHVSTDTPCNGGRDTPAIVVLGIGNLLWADEGFGVRCAELLQRDHEFEPGPRIVDGGTQGLYLIQHVQSADRLLIFDAIDYGLPPGTLRVIRDDEVPQYLGARKMSLHQTGFQEVLSLARLTGHYPERVVLIGCQPEELEDYGGSLRDAVRAVLPEALRLGVETLVEWGCAVRPRRQPLDPAEAVTLPHLAMQRYEAERPGPEQACRVGDERFLVTPGPEHG
ncbi:HyaD/HybD family hydrogenase maturation endopeptidase [Sinimarinibacterium flocculans]|uniref:Hydrogenase 1 maturation peptidase HyaD n=1 Tax=Sinimarinibacterium flocculans TaxID=985250 RepID=A0A318E895_9GAMM|nr:HyaD/HybD family hydrogenase maturation endopeptidase [Sinimarinibacterium flocculans]PXV65657.1 hydrogenase 1 maturation peptidase HyaD [Sinimarinibacterium flocculans]